MSDAIRVLIVDDHPVVRSGLKAALNGKGGVVVVGEAKDGFEAEEVALASKPDVLILDIYMPRRGGLDSMLSIKQKLPDIKVLLLTFSEREEDVLRAFRLGADGYLLKNTGVEEVLSAISEVTTGKVVVPPLIAGRLARMVKINEDRGVLSEREQEVLTLIGEGLTNAEIGKRLFLSPNTVGTYVSRLLGKFNFKNRAAAIAYATRYLNAESAQ